MSYLVLAKKAERTLKGKDGGVSPLAEEEDPLLTPDQWYPHFRDFHHKVIAEILDFDWLWLKEHRPNLHRAIKAKENELDALGPASLFQVMVIMREWRELVLKAEFERREGKRGSA